MNGLAKKVAWFIQKKEDNSGFWCFLFTRMSMQLRLGIKKRMCMQLRLRDLEKRFKLFTLIFRYN
jgi:hypothetical protein